jgi:hypothetical protein
MYYRVIRPIGFTHRGSNYNDVCIKQLCSFLYNHLRRAAAVLNTPPIVPLLNNAVYRILISVHRP